MALTLGSIIKNYVVVVMLVLSLLSIACTGEPECILEEWKYAVSMKKYYRLMLDVPLNYTNANDACKQKGGHLLSIRSEAEQNAVIDALRYCEYGLRFGLRKGPSGQYQWQDGSPLKAGDFNPMTDDDDVPIQNKCVLVRLCRNDWVPDRCSTVRFYLCDAIEPCRSLPVLKFNGEKKFEKIETNITNVMYVDVECILHGEPDAVTMVELKCGNNITATGIKMAKETVLSETLHMMTCTCKSTLRSGNTEMSQVKVVYQLSPCFFKNGTNGTSHTALKGKDFVTEFEIKANPDLTNPILMKQGMNKSDMDSMGHTVKIIKSKTSRFVSSVVITIEKIVSDNGGMYDLMIKNGIPPDLIYTFELKAVKNPSDESSMMGLTLWIVGGLIVLLIIIAIVLFVMKKKAKDDTESAEENTKAAVQDKVLSEEEKVKDENENEIPPDDEEGKDTLPQEEINEEARESSVDENM